MEDQNTKVLSVMKERDFYHAKLSTRLKEISAKVPYRNKRYNNSGQNYRGHH